MRSTLKILTLVVVAAAAALPLPAQDSLAIPKVLEAGNALSIETAGSGAATLYLVSPAGVFKRSVRLGEAVTFRGGEITWAGHYIALLTSESSSQHAEFDVVAGKPASLSFLAKPSRLLVSQSGGISGVAYVFDPFRNLMIDSMPVTFESSSGSSPAQSEKVIARNGVAWVRMNSSSKAGAVQFDVIAGDIREKRVVQLIPGDPCNLRMDTHRSGSKMILQTQPVRDCSGNAVSDGTSITFTESRDGRAFASVDVPLKHDIAQTELPAYDGAVLSVATGVVMGNEIRVGEK